MADTILLAMRSGPALCLTGFLWKDLLVHTMTLTCQMHGWYSHRCCYLNPPCGLPENAHLRVMLSEGGAGAGDQGFHDLDAGVGSYPAHGPQHCGQLTRLQLIDQLPYSCLRAKQTCLRFCSQEGHQVLILHPLMGNSCSLGKLLRLKG